MGGTFSKYVNNINPFSSSSVTNRLLDPFDQTGIRRNARDDSAQAQADRIREETGGKPADIQWNNIYDSDKQSTASGIDQRLQGIGGDRSALDQFKGEAMRQGPSKYAQMAGAQQDNLAKNYLDMGSQQVAGQGATARSQLAMRGGLSGGAAERVATEGQKNYLDMAQNINQQKAMNLGQIGMNDEQNRISQLGQAQGMENDQTGIDMKKLGMFGQAQQFDIGNQMKNSQSQNEFDLGKYREKMGAWGAGQTAQAQALAGKGGKK